MSIKTRSDIRPLILASGSPRRQQFLRDLALDFTIQVADIDESPYPNEHPVALAHRLAESKAQAVAAKFSDDSLARIIIAADTVVALDDLLLGKPIDNTDAMRMLEQLRNRPHQVHSGLSILETGTHQQKTVINSTTVFMRNYSDEELHAYVATGDPLDKAGGYAIQHPVFAPATTNDGCISGVMGLSLVDLYNVLAEFGVTVPTTPIATICQQHTSLRCCQLAD